MSTHTRNRRLTVPQLVAMKGRQKIVSLTAYSSAIAKVIDPLVAADNYQVKWADGFITYSDPDSVADYQAGHPEAFSNFQQINASQLLTAHFAMNAAIYTQPVGAAVPCSCTSATAA